MSYALRILPTAQKAFTLLARKDPQRHRKVAKCLAQSGLDPRYPALNSHKYATKTGPNGEEVWESYVENNVPAAWRVFWVYGPDEPDEENPAGPPLKAITIVAITPHP